MSGRFPIEGDQLAAAPAALERPASDAAARTWQRVVSRRHLARDSAVRRLLALADLLGAIIAMALSLLRDLAPPERVRLGPGGAAAVDRRLQGVWPL